MKGCILILSIILFFIANTSFAQTFTLKKDTIFVNHKPYALFKAGRKSNCLFQSVSGQNLAEIHTAHINIKGKPGYVVTFLNDKRQGMILVKNNNKAFINEVVKNHLIDNGSGINEINEAHYLALNPLPDGYTDVNQLIDF